MPKRVGFLYQTMCDKDFIRRAIIKGSKGKRKRWDVKYVLEDVEKYTDKMYDLLTRRAYVPTKPREKLIYDPSSQKYRSISVVPYFPDGIVHQLLVAAMEPVLMKNMHPNSCASVPGRGTKRARIKATRFIQGDPKGSKYGAELDVRKYYPSIPIARLMKALERKIKDREFLLLVAVALLSYEGGQRAAMKHPFGLYGVIGNARGLCIGFFICQWLANFYLEGLDWFTVKQPGVKYLIRYMDNISIFGPNKKQLHKARQEIARYMEEVLDVRMKDNWQVFPISKRLFSIVGYRIGREVIILRKRNFLRLARQCRRVQKSMNAGRTIAFKTASGLLSRIGQLKHCDSRTIREKYVAPIGINKLKEVVRRESQRQQGTGQCVLTGAQT